MSHGRVPRRSPGPRRRGAATPAGSAHLGARLGERRARARGEPGLREGGGGRGAGPSLQASEPP